MGRTIVIIGFAFAVSTAMEVTGVAQLFASVFVKLSKAIGGQTAPLISIYMTAGLLTEILTNNATAALVYPIAARLGDSLGVSPQLMAIAVMLGSSDAFISPFGYQCNLMSMSAGGYTTMQFIKYGIPLQIIQFAGTSAIFAARGHKWLFALATTALGAAVVLVPLAQRRKHQLFAGRKHAARALASPPGSYDPAALRVVQHQLVVQHRQPPWLYYVYSSKRF